MNERPTATQIEARRLEIRHKRLSTLLGAYEIMAQRYKEVKEFTTLNKSQLGVVVEDYLQEREKLIHRDNITGKIQRHKIAGLMASSIVKYRPIQLIETEPPMDRLSMDNETLAVLHGIAVCAEGNIEKMRTFLALPFSQVWFSDFVYHLKTCPSNSDGFTMIFETLCMTYFPEALAGTSGR